MEGSSHLNWKALLTKENHGLWIFSFFLIKLYHKLEYWDGDNMLEHVFWVSNIYNHRIKLILPQIQCSVDLWMEQYLQMRKYESVDKF